jgi:hypothetical protein
MALLYSYLFPTLFLVAFWALYRYEAVPLVRHAGELLTVTALGGACFGLPTAMVSERERGVWRRIRITPMLPASLVATALVARYVLLLTAALLQLVLAIGVFGMPMPEHPFDLLIAFTLVAFAFMGLGLVIAMAADNVPAVQALGQSIFLPMLIIGGVAVRLESLPVWAQHVSAYFPGRYAVHALQVSVNGDGLSTAGFATFALVAIGLAGFVAGAKLFRWDQQQRFMQIPGKGWAAAAVAAWVLVGAIAQATGQVVPGRPVAASDRSLADVLESQPVAPSASSDLPEQDASADAPRRQPSGDGAAGAAADAPAAAPKPASRAPAEAEPPGPHMAPDDAASSGAASPGAAPAPAASAADWQSPTLAEIRQADFSELPPDSGVVSPVAGLTEPVPDESVATMQCMRSMLRSWQPAMVADPVQRTRNVLYVAAVPDMFQMEEVERWAPRIVWEFLQATTEWEDLQKILYWIATHPGEGDTGASGELGKVCLEVGAPGDIITLRERVHYYALKLLGRMLGVLPL